MDWWDYLTKVSDLDLEYVGHSSCVDHFFMDGDKYYEANLHLTEKRFLSNEEAYDGWELKPMVIGVLNHSDWTYDQWHRHLVEQGRHKVL